jgi:hypothetical protein
MSDRLVGGLLVLAAFLLCVFPLTDTDFWWHLRTGQLIWERGHVPQTDWFLFTDAERPWIDLHWGFQLLVAGLYALGGVNLIILVKAAVLAGAVAIAWSATGSQLPAWMRAAIWIPAVICISGRGYERPEMLSQLFLAMWLWIAFRAETQPKWIWALPAIQVVWINCHALYILGLVVGGCFAVDYAARQLAGGKLGLPPAASRLKPMQVFGSGAACALAALANPYFVQGALFPFVLYRKFSVEQGFYGERIGEFQSPVKFFLLHGFGNIYLDSQIVLAIVAVASFLVLFANYRRWSPFRLLLFAAFLHLGISASRNVNIFAFVIATITVANLSELLSERRAESGKRRAAPTNAGSRLNLVAGGLLIAWMGLTVTGLWGRFAGEQKPFGLGERPWWFGHQAAKFAGQPGFPNRAFAAHIGLAATYEFHNGPEKKVFMDPRLEVASQQTYQRWEQILEKMAAADPSWDLGLKDENGDLPVVLLDSRTVRPAILGMLLTPGWRLVYADPAAAVFLSLPKAEALGLPTADFRPLQYPP